ncbi:MAG: anthranilate phosphoribosyltransferase [Actinomycetota bacterium]
MSYSWSEVLGSLTRAQDLSREQAAWAMEHIMQGAATPAQLGAFLAALRTKGETVEEMVGLVETMRAFSLKVDVDYPVVDTCGTGGDRQGTVNVSTTSALVLAGAGTKVAKHGNRAASSRCGSADVLEALGVKIDLDPAGVKRCLDEAGIGFCFARTFHPSMRHAGPVRAELSVATVFNFLGPLTNPAGARRQALGVSDPAMAPKMVQVLDVLGTERALVFHGWDGLDELSLSGPSHVWDLNGGEVREYEVDPAVLGLAAAPASALKGGSAEENAVITRAVLEGEVGPVRDVIVLNSAAGAVAAGLAKDISQGLGIAVESIDSGAASRALALLVEISNA